VGDQTNVCGGPDQCLWILWATVTHEFTCIYFLFNLHKEYLNHIIYQLPTNVRPHEPLKFWLPTNIDPHELK
jgi:hypothetical protein